MSAQNGKSGKKKKKKAIYSEEFQAMLERIEEEDNADTSGQLMKRSRLCLEKVKGLEKHFEEDNKLQPERKLKIAEEVGLEPRQVAIWFQNRRARWRTKQLEREYGDLRASYDALINDYASLEQQKLDLLVQLKELKGKIESRNSEMATNIAMINRSNIVRSESSCMNVGLSGPSSSCSTASDPFAMPTTMSMEGIQLYQDRHFAKMEDLDSHYLNNNTDISPNFFSVDQAPTLHYWSNNTHHFN